LRERGLEQAIRSHADGGRAVLGICGGFQMLCRSIDDAVESRSGRVEAMGMLDADITFAPDKVLRRRQDDLYGYEIHHGRVDRCAEAAWFDVDGVPEGYRRGQVFGTHWHGLFDNDAFRRQWLTTAATAAGRDGFVVADDTNVAARRDAQLDLMADLLDAHLDVDAVTGLLNDGPPRRSTIVATLR
jgi:adenosylcobyric acid synthase